MSAIPSRGGGGRDDAQRDPGSTFAEEQAPDPEPTFEAQREMGFQFPAEWAAPLLRVTNGEVVAFCGTVTILGGGWFLTARHVIEDAVALDDKAEFAVVVFDSDVGVGTRVVGVTRFEHVPDGRTDLTIGRLVDEAVKNPWGAIGLSTIGMDVACYGYPMATAAPGEVPQLDLRALKGHISRRLRPDTLVPGEAIELSFAPTEGMSGSPIVIVSPDQRPLLVGVAVGAQPSYIRQHSSLFFEDEAKGDVYRIVEFGIGIRLSAYVRWKPKLAGGMELGEIVPLSQPLAST
jgi:Trypsin-like peptidase domain